MPTTAYCFNFNAARSLSNSIQYYYAIYFKIITVLSGSQKASLTIREADHSLGLLTKQFVSQKSEKLATNSWKYFNLSNINQ